MDAQPPQVQISTQYSVFKEDVLAATGEPPNDLSPAEKFVEGLIISSSDRPNEQSPCVWRTVPWGKWQKWHRRGVPRLQAGLEPGHDPRQMGRDADLDDGASRHAQYSGRRPGPDRWRAATP